MDDVVTRAGWVKWRTGRRVGRTLYQQVGAEPADTDPLVGVMDTAALAALVVRAVNRMHQMAGAGDG